MTPFRVRQVLDNLDTESKRLLKLCVPKEHRSAPKELLTLKGVFPHAIKKLLPKDDACSILGICTEDLLQIKRELTPTDLTNVLTRIKTEYKTENKEDEEIKLDSTSESYLKALKSVTTQNYFNHIEATQESIAVLCEEEKLEYNRELVHGSGKIIGHPDIMTHTKILEVKTSTNIKESWVYNVMQVLSYSAIVPSYTQVYLVFPLQEYIYHMDLSVWTKGKEFLNILLTSINQSILSQEAYIEGRLMRGEYLIGSHVSREKKTIYETLRNLPSEYPWQLFLESNLVTKKTISDEILAKTLNLITERSLNVYVHSPYTINLCTPHEEKDGYHYTALQKNLLYAKSMGMKGVVVHVGKTTSLDIKLAMENMKNFIKLSLEEASIDCPLLLETPAGQGTEVLTTASKFAKFILGMKDERLGVCVDLCHVFAAGEIPSEYLNILFSKGIIPKLIHFNDSIMAKGTCKDRHAQIGKGKIGIEELRKCALMCQTKGIPMLTE